MAGVVAAGVAVAGAASSAIGSSNQAGAAKSAAKQQADTARYTADLQHQQYMQTRGDLQPFVQAGYDANGQLNGLYQGSRNDTQDAYQRAQDALPGSMGQAELEATPGYQFNLSQGLRSVQNSAAAKGLGVSGAAMQGAAQYATGLANSTYKDQFNIKQQQFQDANQQFANQLNRSSNYYNQIMGQSTLGENAAAFVGKTGADATTQQANSLNQGAQATSAGMTTAANINANQFGNAAATGLGAYKAIDQAFGKDTNGGSSNFGNYLNNLFGSGQSAGERSFTGMVNAQP